jgi:ATP-dependent Clp protease ATP-binding subunit ClpA
MPKRLSVDVRKLVLASAKEEASRRGDRRLGTDHLLLGLLHDEDSRAAQALGVSLADARAASDALDRAALAAVGIQIETLGEGLSASFGRRFPPLTSGARAVFKRAIDEARPSGSGRIDTTHFLLALLSLQRPDPAAELLDALRVDPAAVRKRLGGPAGGEAA